MGVGEPGAGGGQLGAGLIQRQVAGASQVGGRQRGAIRLEGAIAELAGHLAVGVAEGHAAPDEHEGLVRRVQRVIAGASGGLGADLERGDEAGEHLQQLAQWSPAPRGWGA